MAAFACASCDKASREVAKKFAGHGKVLTDSEGNEYLVKHFHGEAFEVEAIKR